MAGGDPQLTLFVTGDAPRSRRARANLETALSMAGQSGMTVREIDLLVEPQPALEHGIFATPALMLSTPGGDTSVMYGDLSDAGRLKRFLGTAADPAT